jgi:hypothetical protein
MILNYGVLDRLMERHSTLLLCVVGVELVVGVAAINAMTSFEKVPDASDGAG